MEIAMTIGELILGVVLGFVGAAVYNRYRLWKIKRYAPSATATSFHVGLLEEDYQRLRKLSKTERDVMYAIRKEIAP